MKSESSSPPPTDSSAELPSPRATPLAVPLPPKGKRADAERKRGLFRRFFGATIVLAAWLGVLILLAGAAARLFYHDGAIPLIWFNAFTLYVYLPAYFVLLFAVWRKRRWLAWVAAVVVACHLCWAGPDFVPIERAFSSPDANSATTRSFRLYFHNVYGSGRDFDATFQEIEAANPDIVVLTEFNSLWRKAAIERKLQDRYRINTLPWRRGHGYSVAFSKLPIEYKRLPLVPGRSLLDLTIDVDGSPLQILGVHSPRPMPDGSGRSPQEYENFYRGLIARVASADGPLIVIGDFNATQHARLFQRLTAGRLRSAHRDLGRGYATSWPNGKEWLPPIRIDHALVSPEIECLDIQEGIGPDSDHKPVILDFRIHVPPK